MFKAFLVVCFCKLILGSDDDYTVFLSTVEKRYLLVRKAASYPKAALICKKTFKGRLAHFNSQVLAETASESLPTSQIEENADVWTGGKIIFHRPFWIGERRRVILFKKEVRQYVKDSKKPRKSKCLAFKSNCGGGPEFHPSDCWAEKAFVCETTGQLVDIHQHPDGETSFNSIETSTGKATPLQHFNSTDQLTAVPVSTTTEEPYKSSYYGDATYEELPSPIAHGEPPSSLYPWQQQAIDVTTRRYYLEKLPEKFLSGFTLKENKTKKIKSLKELNLSVDDLKHQLAIKKNKRAHSKSKKKWNQKARRDSDRKEQDVLQKSNNHFNFTITAGGRRKKIRMEYMLFRKQVPWNTAKSLCRSYNLTLASLVEGSVIAKYLSKSRPVLHKVWIDGKKSNKYCPILTKAGEAGGKLKCLRKIAFLCSKEKQRIVDKSGRRTFDNVEDKSESSYEPLIKLI